MAAAAAMGATAPDKTLRYRPRSYSPLRSGAALRFGAVLRQALRYGRYRALRFVRCLRTAPTLAPHLRFRGLPQCAVFRLRLILRYRTQVCPLRGHKKSTDLLPQIGTFFKF